MECSDVLHDRVIAVAKYIVEHGATVRQTAKEFGISKSTVHMEVTMRNGGKVRLFGWLNSGKVGALSGGNLGVFFDGKYKFYQSEKI
ncbi:MAG: hypothetical protein E7299_04665 [Lachnospiraceae bacterium]|nr:hypothetical protein [Lachnospiraceae bacterium]